MPPLQGLIFDLEGTLLDSTPDIRQALNRTLRSRGRRALEPEEARKMIGDGLLSLLNRAFAMTGEKIPDADSYALFQEFITYYRDQEPDPEQLYPHAKETVEKFHGAGVKLGICTNKQEAGTNYLLDVLGMKRYFAFVAGGDTFPVHKPNPGHVKGVIEKLAVPAAHCAMVGDSQNDTHAARGAGIPCLVITHGHNDDFERLGATALIKEFPELPGALKKLGFETSF